jgi:hypothetical protein
MWYERLGLRSCAAALSCQSMPLPQRASDKIPGPQLIALFAWLTSHQPTVLFSQNKPATSNQSAVLFSQNKPAPAISHQPTERAACALCPVAAAVACWLLGGFLACAGAFGHAFLPAKGPLILPICFC